MNLKLFLQSSMLQRKLIIILFYFLNYEKVGFEVELLNTHCGER